MEHQVEFAGSVRGQIEWLSGNRRQSVPGIDLPRELTDFVSVSFFGLSRRQDGLRRWWPVAQGGAKPDGVVVKPQRSISTRASSSVSNSSTFRNLTCACRTAAGRHSTIAWAETNDSKEAADARQPDHAASGN